METEVIFIAYMIIFLNSGLFAQNNLQPTGRSLDNENLWTSWSSCSSSENCVKKRMRNCIHEPNPYLSCKEGPYEEKIRNCEICQDGFWFIKDNGKCLGKGCNGRKQRVVKGCSNTFKNAKDCERITTKFCKLSKTCDGSWGEWTSLTNCSITSSSLFQCRRRWCIKDGKLSYACLKGNSSLSQTILVPRDKLKSMQSSTISSTTTSTTISATATSTSTSTVTTAMMLLTTIPSNKSKELFLFEKLQPIGGCLWKDPKSIALVIETVTIFVLIALLLYCFLQKRNQTQRSKSVPSIVLQPSQTISAVQYTQAELLAKTNKT